MSRMLAILLFAASATPAFAAPFTTQMSCEQARGIVERQGSVVLYESPHVYDRYVSDRGHCLITQITKPATVRTRDTPTCPIGGTCIEPDTNHDSFFDR